MNSAPVYHTTRWLLFAAVGVALVAHAAYYYPYLTDDTLISLRYVRRLCEGGGLTWNDGERVEGYTNFLWILLNAPVACAGGDPIWSTRALGTIGVLTAIWWVSRTGSSATPTASRLLTGGLVLAMSPPLAIWAIGGLEHGFMAAPLAAGIFFTTRHPQGITVRDAAVASAAFGALALLRADGIGLFLAATVGRYLYRRPRLAAWRAELAWFIFPAIFLSAHLAFRVAYYGEWVPNTAVAKVSLGEARLLTGLEWVTRGLKAQGVVIVAAVVATWVTRRSAPFRSVLAWSIATAWCAYLVLVGGDTFSGWRQLSLILPPLAFVIADAGEAVAASRQAPELFVNGFWWAVALGVSFRIQTTERYNEHAKEERWEWDGLPLGLALKQAFGRAQPLLAVDAAGALPYWSELPSLDMLGLNDPYLPRHPPPDFGHGFMGHELGEGAYVWRRKPDIVGFCLPKASREPCFRGGRELVSEPGFADQYHLVHLMGLGKDAPTGEFYFRKDSPRIGLHPLENGVEIPAYLFGGEAAVAHPASDGTLVVESAGNALAFNGLSLAQGTWVVRAEPAPESWSVETTCEHHTRRDAEGSAAAVHLDSPMRVDLRMVSSARRALGRVRVERKEGVVPGTRCTQEPSMADVFER